MARIYRSLCALIWIACLPWAAVVVEAYEIRTHERITQSAFDGSVLSGGYLEEELGVSRSSKFLGSDGQAFNVADWLAEGSTREDDVHLFSLSPFRFRHHFYDPVYDRGLTGNFNGGAVSVGRRAFEWALEDPDQISGQDFSWRDARRYFLTGLTASSPGDREAAMASTFRALGQVTHLIQDMGVPEHTRNDWHAGVIAPWYPFGTPSIFEHRINERRATFTYGGYPSPQLPRLRHFWTTGDGRGLAEFTNRNFVSKDTNFTEAVDGNTGRDNFGSPYPLPRLDLSLRTDVDVASPDAPACAVAAGLSGKVTFFGNDVSDVVTGEVIRNNYLTTYSIFDDGLKKKGQPGIFSLNFCTVEAAAAILLPRATGYSAALLDYFFRGKLDVDLVDDGGGLRLAGTNASPDPLDGGTLAVYADGTDGVRRLASAAVAVGRLEAGGALPAVPVTPSPGAERFVAVYTGTLGEERAADTFKGGVIGKVLGGVRVEEVFSGGTRWQLRTPQGVFPLPIPAGRDNIVELRWGDADNTLVGRTDIGPDRPNLMLAYKINRPAGSVTMPLVTQPDGSRMVDVQETSRKSFPVGLYLGTTIQFSHTIQYKRYLTTLVPTVEYEFDGSGYTFARVADVQAHLDLVVDDAQTLRRSDPVILGWVTEPYNWYVSEIGLTADGKILALVGVWLTSPGDEVAVFSGPFDRPEEIPYEFPPMIGYTWALVNVTDGTVVGGTSTAPPDLVIDHTTTVTRGGGGVGWYTGETVIRYVGGVFPPPERREPGVTFFAPGPCDTPPAQLLGTVLMQNETSAISVVQYRPEIAGQQFADPARLQAPDRTGYWVYLCGQPQSVGIVVTARTSEFTLGRLDNAFRAPGDGTGEQLTLLMLQSQPRLGYWDLGKVLTWFPERTTAELRAELTRPALHYLQAASRQSALVITDVYEPDFDETTSLVALTGDPAVQVFGTGLWDFRLLAPSYLYNPFDLKFYRLVPPLTATALPAALSGASGNPIGAYHAVRLP